MKLGIKNTYIDIEAKFIKGKFIMEDYTIFFYSKIDTSKYTFLYIRSYRIISIILKELDPELYYSLKEKSIEPPILLVYIFNLILDVG